MKQPHDKLRAQYLELCQAISEHITIARNHGMKPGNAWLARAEVAKISSAVSELEDLLDQIKAADREG